MTPAHERLIVHWKKRGALPAPPATPEAITAFERKHAVRFPDDFRSYLLDANGMSEAGIMDNEGFCFWNLSQMKTLRQLNLDDGVSTPGFDENSYFAFADYLIWSWAYAIDLGRESTTRGQVIHVGTLQPRIIAESFTDFVESYVADSPNLYPDPISESSGEPIP